MTGWPVLSLCQIAAVRARMRVQDADDDALGGAAAVAFQVKLALEGLVDRFDDLAQRLEELRPGAPGLALADRAQQRQVTLGELVLEVAAEVVLVPDQGLPGPAATRSGSASSMPSRTSRSSALAPARANSDRQPVQGAHQVQPQAPEVPGVAGAVPVLRPPGQRRCALTVSRDRPHSTGVESTTQTSSLHSVVSIASIRMTPDEQDERLPQPLVVPGLARAAAGTGAQVGAGVPQPPALGREAQQRRITAMVTSSASLSSGAMPSAGPPRRQFRRVRSRSSILTYSAVARVSMSLSTTDHGDSRLVMPCPGIII